MNKSPVVGLTTIAIILAGWFGSSWYTGVMAEKQIKNLIGQANQRLQKDDIHLTIKLANYQRGLFSSQAQFKLSFNHHELTINDKMFHGPLPLANLRQMHFSPTALVSHITIENTPYVSDWFTLTHNQSPIVIDMQTSYNQQTHSSIKISPLAYKSKEAFVNFAGGKFDFAFDKNFDPQNYQLNLSDFNLHLTQLTPFPSEQFTLKLAGLSFAQDYNKTNTFALDEFKVNSPQSNILISNIKFDSKEESLTSTSGNAFSYLFDIGNITLDKHNFGTNHFKLKLSNVAPQLISLYQQNMEQDKKILITLLRDYINNQTITNDLLPINDHSVGFYLALLQNFPNIEQLNWQWETPEGTSELNFSANFNPINRQQLKELIDGRFPDFWIKSINSSLNISLYQLANVFAYVEQTTHGTPEQEAKKMGLKEVNQLQLLAVSSDFFSKIDNSIATSFIYNNNSILLNKRDYTLEEIAQLYDLFVRQIDIY